MARLLLLGLTLAGWGISPDAHAGNSSRPRVPPSFLGGQCLVDVDRTQDPVVDMPLGIPFEDTELTEDEPVDSRTFQFFAMCQELPPLQDLPAWIDADDAARAIEADPSIEPPEDLQILQPGSDWASCAQPITAESERVPISCDATADGARWDTTDVPPGSYVVWGYTFEPPLNLWTPRPGVVRVHDGDPEAVGPALAFTYPNKDVNAHLESGIRLEGCAAGAEGTTVELSFATAKELDATGSEAWQPFDSVAIDDGLLEIDFMPPPELLYQAVFFRGVASDPQGRTWTAFTSAPTVFLEGCDEPRGGRTPNVDHCGGAVEPQPEGRSAMACGEQPADPQDEGPQDDEPEGDPIDEPAEDENDEKPEADGDEFSEGGCRIVRRRHHHAPLIVTFGLGLVALRRRRRSTEAVRLMNGAGAAVQRGTPVGAVVVRDERVDRLGEALGCIEMWQMADIFEDLELRVGHALHQSLSDRWRAERVSVSPNEQRGAIESLELIPESDSRTRAPQRRECVEHGVGAALGRRERSVHPPDF